MPAARFEQADDPVVTELLARIVVLEAELAALLPPKSPSGWINVKTAAVLAGTAASTTYARARRGRILSVKIKGRIWIDPASIN